MRMTRSQEQAGNDGGKEKEKDFLGRPHSSPSDSHSTGRPFPRGVGIRATDESSIIVAPGQLYDCRAYEDVNEDKDDDGDSPGGKIPITRCPINQSLFNRRPGKLIEFGRA